MWILGPVFLFGVVSYALEFYKRVFQLVLMDCASVLKFLSQSGTSNSELRGGFLLLGCFPPGFNILGLFLIFVLGLVFLRFTWQGKGLAQFLCDVRGKPGDIKNGLSSSSDLDGVCNPKFMSFKVGSVKLENLKLGDGIKHGLFSKEVSDEACDSKVKSCKCEKSLEGSNLIDDGDTSEDEQEKGSGVEDEVLDIMVLRKLVKSERRKADLAYAEVDKERMAAASAAEEAMAMILRLQSEKSALEIEANQYRRWAEQKHELDREVIQSLQWIIMKHEWGRSELEGKLRLCREKLKAYAKGDKGFEGLDDGSLSFLGSTTMEDGAS